MTEIDIYDLGFETVRLELPIHQKECFMTNKQNTVVDDTNKYLVKKYESYKAIVSGTTDPRKLKNINDSGLKVIRVDYCCSWYEEEAVWNATFPRHLYLHYIVFKDEEEEYFFKLTHK